MYYHLSRMYVTGEPRNSRKWQTPTPSAYICTTYASAVLILRNLTIDQSELPIGKTVTFTQPFDYITTEKSNKEEH